MEMNESFNTMFRFENINILAIYYLQRYVYISDSYNM